VKIHPINALAKLRDDKAIPDEADIAVYIEYPLSSVNRTTKKHRRHLTVTQMSRFHANFLDAIKRVNLFPAQKFLKPEGMQPTTQTRSGKASFSQHRRNES
jgi:hypothetical protein